MTKDPKIYNMDLFTNQLTGVTPSSVIDAREIAKEKKLLQYPIQISTLEKEIKILEKEGGRSYSLDQAKKKLSSLKRRYNKLLNKL